MRVPKLVYVAKYEVNAEGICESLGRGPCIVHDAVTGMMTAGRTMKDGGHR